VAEGELSEAEAELAYAQSRVDALKAAQAPGQSS
jgi:hypothetical protein